MERNKTKRGMGIPTAAAARPQEREDWSNELAPLAARFARWGENLAKAEMGISGLQNAFCVGILGSKRDFYENRGIFEMPISFATGRIGR